MFVATVTTVAHFPEITSALPYQRPDYSKDLIYRPHKPRIFYSERERQSSLEITEQGLCTYVCQTYQILVYNNLDWRFKVSQYSTNSTINTPYDKLNALETEPKDILRYFNQVQIKQTIYRLSSILILS